MILLLPIIIKRNKKVVQRKVTMSQKLIYLICLNLLYQKILIRKMKKKPNTL